MKSLKEILTDITDITMRQSILNFKSMSICQKLGFNGLKRWHKCFAKKMFDLSICVELKAYDYYAVTLDARGDISPYDAKSIIYHLQSFKDLTSDELDKLGELNKEFFTLTGFEIPFSCEIKRLLLKQVEKFNRLLTRYKSIGSEATGLHDLLMYDDALHKKLKKEEYDVRN